MVENKFKLQIKGHTESILHLIASIFSSLSIRQCHRNHRIFPLPFSF